MEQQYNTFKSKEDFDQIVNNSSVKLFRQKYLKTKNQLVEDVLNRNMIPFDGNAENYEVHDNRLYARISENKDTHLYLLLYTTEPSQESRGGKRKRKTVRRTHKKKRSKRRKQVIKSRMKTRVKRQNR